MIILKNEGAFLLAMSETLLERTHKSTQNKGPAEFHKTIMELPILCSRFRNSTQTHSATRILYTKLL